MIEIINESSFQTISFNWLVFWSTLFTDIVHSCVNTIVSHHFKAFSCLLRAAKDPIEDFLENEFRKAEEKVLSQFRMEKIVYSQDSLYSRQLEAVKQQPSTAFVISKGRSISADVREMAQHLNAYLMVII